MTSLRTQAVPARYKDWLEDTGSLTRKLVMACNPGNFTVRLLRQRWLRPLYSESQVLGMRQGEVALTREVQLLCNGTPWVFARTLIPATSFNGKARRLAFLGNRPLGALLFSDPATQRKSMQFARLADGQPMHLYATEGLENRPAELWGRRTLFYYAQQPLLVNEIFLPEITGDCR
jgi:chorismate--pyruvate lyase